MNTPLLQNLQPQELQTILGAAVALHHNHPIATVLTDSRSLVSPADTLFFAISTDSGDGHRYIQALYDAGVRSFVVEHLPCRLADFPETNWYQVPSSLRALQRLASWMRHRLTGLQLVGITGSNGKTIVKEFAYQLLSSELAVYRTPRSYNSQLGVPLSLLGLRPQHQLALIEAGISRPGEMSWLAEITAPTIGLFTGLGSAHQENFPNLAAKLSEKIQLFRGADTLIFGSDDALVRETILATYPSARHLTWSRQDASAYIYIESAEEEGMTTLVTLRHQGKSYQQRIPFTDQGYLEDVFAVLVLVALIRPELLQQSELCMHLRPIAMRLEVKEGLRGNTLINDSYSCDLQSLSIALDFLRRRATSTQMRPVLLLSDIEQTGLADADLYPQVADLCRSYGVEELYLVGPHLSKAAGLFAPLPVHRYPSTEALLLSGELTRLSDVCLLIKGARRFAFERLYHSLSTREHQTVLDIDLSAVVANLNHYRSLLPAGHPLICMIKADGYGTGAFELARTLQEHHVDYLAVAVADEGRALRERGIRTPIMVMNPELSSASTLFAHQLEPEVYSFELLEGLAEQAAAEGLVDFPIHLKIDSGMHRFGFAPEDVAQIAERLSRCSSLRVSSAFSHLAAADCGEEKRAFTIAQCERFLAATDSLFDQLGYRPRRHILNTAGIECYPEYALDMARLGLGLYGLSPTGKSGLQPIARLSTVILQTRDLEAGEAIGYGCRGVTSRPSRIGVIPIGYADGFPRRLSCGRYAVSVRGVLCPTIGNICMDACMIDLTKVPEAKAGDEVILFGSPDRPIEALAEALDTIPYEVLTALSTRIQRRYWRE